MMSRLEEELDSFEHGWKAPKQRMRYVFTNNYWLGRWHPVQMLCIDALLILFTLWPSTLSRHSLKTALSWNQIFQWTPQQILTKTQRLLMCLVTLLGHYVLLSIRCVVIFSARCGTPSGDSGEGFMVEYWLGSGLTFPASFLVLLQVLCWGRFATSWAHQVCLDALVLNVWFARASIVVKGGKLPDFVTFFISHECSGHYKIHPACRR